MPEGEIKLRPEIESLSVRLEADPKSKVFAQLADAYRKSNMTDEAIEIVKKGLEIHPNYAAAHFVLGRCYLEKRIYSLAREEFDRVASLDPHNVVALKLLADVQFAQGAKEEAVRRYRQVLDMDPMNAEVAERLAELLPPPVAQEPEAELPEPSVAVVEPEKKPPVSPEETAAPSLLEPEIHPEEAVQEAPSAVASAAEEAPPPTSEEQVISPAVEPVPEPPQAPVEPSQAPTGMERGRILPRTRLTSEDVSGIVNKMFIEKASETPAVPLAEEAPAPKAIEATPEVPPSVEPAPEPEKAVAERATAITPETPLSGEEISEVIEGLLMERSLAVPAISAPEAPGMIEHKPSEAAPVMKVDETPVPAKAKEVGATATLAELYEQQGFYDKALELYEQVLALNPEDSALAAKVRELKSRTYWEESTEAEAPSEIEKTEEEAPPEETQREEAAIVPPEEKTAVAVVEEKPAGVEPVSSPQPCAPLFQPEAGPKHEGPERGKEIKSFQGWLDSLRKPKD